MSYNVVQKKPQGWDMLWFDGSMRRGVGGGSVRGWAGLTKEKEGVTERQKKSLTKEYNEGKGVYIHDLGDHPHQLCWLC
jgi:hypothetical protein